jgi:hypothetical protein
MILGVRSKKENIDFYVLFRQAYKKRAYVPARLERLFTKKSTKHARMNYNV